MSGTPMRRRYTTTTATASPTASSTALTSPTPMPSRSAPASGSTSASGRLGFTSRVREDWSSLPQCPSWPGLSRPSTSLQLPEGHRLHRMILPFAQDQVGALPRRQDILGEIDEIDGAPQRQPDGPRLLLR